MRMFEHCIQPQMDLQSRKLFNLDSRSPISVKQFEKCPPRANSTSQMDRELLALTKHSMACYLKQRIWIVHSSHLGTSKQIETDFHKIHLKHDETCWICLWWSVDVPGSSLLRDLDLGSGRIMHIQLQSFKVGCHLRINLPTIQEFQLQKYANKYSIDENTIKSIKYNQ